PPAAPASQTSPLSLHDALPIFAGKLTATRYIPGRRFSVNAATTCGLKNLFCRNERVVCWFETADGPMALVLVGALNVSSISMTGDRKSTRLNSSHVKISYAVFC